ncbi:NYN domain-containing protein [Halochromatium roseum]|uniref:NYN domain-containing protein n=1 Tax=Halochromatium roseum TaxID=391920 RepID=UPI001911F95A|nr:NYN domain-containing protein [Halochromatium roseum]
MERIVIFSDHANMAAAFDQLGYPLDQADLIDYLTEGRFLVEAHTFVPIDPRDPSGRDTLIEALWKVGYLVHSKVGTIAGDGYRCNFDVDLTLEMMRTAEIVKPDIIVLLSGDKDFVPAILELRRRGIRVEIAAFPGHNAARDIMLKGSGFIDLERYRQQRWEAHETLPEPPCADFKDNAVAREDAPA